MFEAFLSCRVFGLPEDSSSAYLEVAKSWSGQELIANDGKVQWGDLTRVQTASAKWYVAPPAADIRVYHALVALGSSDRIQYFGFISPLAGMPAAFKNAAVEYLQDRTDGAVKLVDRLTVDLGRFVIERWSDISKITRRLEGAIGSQAAYELTGWDGESPPPITSLECIEMSLGNRRTRIDRKLNIKVDDVSSDIDVVTDALRETFEMVQPYLTPDR